MRAKNDYPAWVLAHKKAGTEIKYINGKYYLYGVTSTYDKTLKKSKKKSLGILGRITEAQGFIASHKRALLSAKSYTNEPFVREYGFSKWLLDTMEATGMLQDLKLHFPSLWQFVVCMVYCRIGYQSPLKNVPFHLSHASLLSLLSWDAHLTDQKISDLLFILGTHQQQMHQYMQPKDQQTTTVLIDATDVMLQSTQVALAQKGYNADMKFQPQFVLLYLYDAQTLRPLYYRILPGNIRDVAALQNTLKMSGMEHCVYIADKGFFSEANLSELERLQMQYIIPLRRDNKCIPYTQLENIEQTDNYFEHKKRFIFFTNTTEVGQTRKIELFLDGKLKEQEKTDYLRRVQTLPESYSKPKFNEKFKTMGTLAVIHNTPLNPKVLYKEYKNRGEVEQFFDHLKNTLDATASYMQREESLNAWTFINHLSMQIIYKLYMTLKQTPLNKKQTMNHKYAITDVIEHLKTIKKIQFNPKETVIAEIDKNTKILLQKLKIHIP
jgi:transposase